ncbi:MAG: hypothetical protein CVV56_08080 [Tenericutes bacterium HGW-Tenericutes-1]|jgi:hypothetical protein|nr:MAG: hypothetical protein CVV56_08080 [Tenericutes bacterium HGW-Tenericutes-1]PKM95803.1 MAG: hypothetical protein CVU84_03110 [Firmicutes bacterium HGW-Firmicutes-1]
MLKLKDLLESDLNTFINTDDFSEIHKVNGVDMEIIIDKEQLKEHASKIIGDDGLYEVNVLFYVKKSEYGIKPVCGERISIDGDKFKCYDVNEEGMLYIIELVAIDS